MITKAVTIARNTIALTEKIFSQIQLGIFTSGDSDNIDMKDLSVITVITIVLNLFYLSNFSLSIDDEVHALTPSSRWWLSIGRWTTAIIDRFVFPRPVLPYVPYLFFSLCLALSYFFLIKTHDIHKNYRKYFALPVFVAYPIWQLMTGFDSMLPAISIGLVLVTFSGLLFERTRHMSVKKTYAPLLISMGIQAILLATAIGAYQSFLLMYLAIVFGTVLIKIMYSEKETLKTLIHSITQAVVISTLGVFIYYSIGLLARWITNTPPSSYLEGFYNFNSFSGVKQLILSFFKNIFAYYSGDASRFGVNFFASKVLMLLSILFIIQRLWHESIFKKISGILLWFMVVLSPFLYSLFLVAPSRTLFTIAYVVWLMAILLLTANRKVFLGINITVIIFLILQSLNINGLYNARSLIAQQYDRSLAADIYKSLGSVDSSFDRNQPVFIDVYGTINFDAVYPNPWSGTIGVSFFDWDGGNLTRMIYYMQLMGYLNIQQLPDEQRLTLTPEFEKMPAWPATGYVKKIDNIYLIKLSNSADNLHKQFVMPAP